MPSRQPSSSRAQAASLALVLTAALLLAPAAAAPAAGFGSSTPQRPLRLLFMPFWGDCSPSFDLMGVAAVLQARGHAVAMAAVEGGEHMAQLQRAARRHTSNTTAAAIRAIPVRLPPNATDTSAAVSRSLQCPSQLSAFLLLNSVHQYLAQPCAALLTDKEALQAVRAFRPDAIAGISVPMEETDSCGCVLSHLLGVPFVDINGHPLVATPLSTPQFGSGLSLQDLSTARGRAANAAAWAVRKLVPPMIMDWGRGNPWPRLRAAAGLPRAASACHLSNLLWRLRGAAGALSGALLAPPLQRCSSLVEVMLGSWLVEPPRPLAANQVLVGPGSPRRAQPIQPADVASFVAGASQQHGLVLASFGSSPLQSAMLSRTDLQELAAAFAALAPTRVLLVLGQPAASLLDDAPVPLGANTKLVPWVDLNDVLGHPATRVFVSHCGLHSVNEAVFHGIPVVGLPLQFEQAEHALRLMQRGTGLVSREAPAFRDGGRHAPQHFTRGAVLGLLQEALSNRSYADAARGPAAALQLYSARRHPYERAADEIELALTIARARAALQEAGGRGGVAADGAAAHASTPQQHQQQRLEL